MYLLYLLDDVDVVWNIMTSFFLSSLMLFENTNITFEKTYSLKISINMSNERVLLITVLWRGSLYWKFISV